jgi:hypothetical protein
VTISFSRRTLLHGVNIFSKINRFINKFEMAGTIVDIKKGAVGQRRVRTPKNIALIQQALTHSLRESARCFSQHLALGELSTYRIVSNSAKLFVSVQN